MRNETKCPVCGRTVGEARQVFEALETGELDDGPIPCASTRCVFDFIVAEHYERVTAAMRDEALTSWARSATRRAARR